MKRISPKIRTLLALLVLAVLAVWFGNDVIRAVQGQRTSSSEGTARDGSIRDAMRLPSSGDNFRTYSRFGSLIGRTSVHHKVHDTVLESYAALGEEQPETTWVFGETGWPWGGDFWPHRTHQNGLVVDFMTPVKDANGPRPIPTWPWQAFGYGLEFDGRGAGESAAEGLSVDFEALAAHLAALDRAAQQNGLRIRKVILAPDLRKQMLERAGTRQIKRLPYSRKPVWVRHDDHYHVEFEVVSR